MNKIDLSKLKKCNQVWDDMPISEGGRTCLKCNHTIIDFRDKSDLEIIRMHSSTDGPVCGLYTDHQLNHKSSTKLSKSSKKGLLVAMTSFMLSHHTHAQVNADTVPTELSEPQYEASRLETSTQLRKQTKCQDSIVIHGTVKSIDGDNMISTNIFLEGSNVGNVADFDGKYLLNICDSLLNQDSITLVYSYVGYETVRVHVNTSQLTNLENRKIDVIMKESPGLSFYVIEKQPLPKRIWNGIKRFFSRII